MDQDAIDTLRDEAAPAADALPVTADAANLAVVADPGLVSALSMAVAGISVPICRRAHVTPLEPCEADMLGQAIGQLVTVYDAGPRDPKGQAWLGFGLAALAVAGGRKPLPDAPKAIEPPVDAPAAPAFGSTGAQSLGVTTSPLEAVPCG